MRFAYLSSSLVAVQAVKQSRDIQTSVKEANRLQIRDKQDRPMKNTVKQLLQQDSTCDNTNAAGTTDIFGDDCSYYDMAPYDCYPSYNTADFDVLFHCCACGGGSTGSNAASDPVDTEV